MVSPPRNVGIDVLPTFADRRVVRVTKSARRGTFYRAATLDGGRRLAAAPRLPPRSIFPRQPLVDVRKIRDFHRPSVIENLLRLARTQRHDAEQHRFRETRRVVEG